MVGKGDQRNSDLARESQGYMYLRRSSREGEEVLVAASLQWT